MNSKGCLQRREKLLYVEIELSRDKEPATFDAAAKKILKRIENFVQDYSEEAITMDCIVWKVWTFCSITASEDRWEFATWLHVR